MSNLRLAPVLLAFALTAATLAGFAGTATAQAEQNATTITIAVTPTDAPIKPLAELRSVKLSGIYSGTAGVSTVNTVITIKADTFPSWAIVSVSPATVTAAVLGATQGGSAQFNIPWASNLLIATTADAPAFTPGEIKVTVTALGNVQLRGSTATDGTVIQAGFFSILDAQAASTIQIARPQTQVVYPITLTNLGNAQTKALFEITDKPEGWNVQTPTPVTLDSRQQGGKNFAQTINLNILTPYHNGYLNDVGGVTMKVTSNYALDVKEKGDTTIVSVLTTNRGFYVPGFEVLFGLASLGAVALIVRRRA